MEIRVTPIEPARWMVISLSASHTRLAVIVAITTALLVVDPAHAQSAAPSSSDHPARLELNADWSTLPRPTACIRAIPHDHMFVAPVLLSASLADSDNAALSVQADLLAQDLSQQILVQLGAATGDVPDLDSTLAPEAVPAELTVIFRPDGSARRRAMSFSRDTMATRMLTNAFDSLRASSEAAMIWPDGYLADSILVRVELTSAILTANGNVRLDATRHPAFRVFRLLAPPMTAALVRPNQPAPKYPTEAEQARVEAAVLLRFIIDTNGRAVPSSFRDVRPLGWQRMNGEAIQYHDAFARSTRDAVLRWRFSPARIGPCPVMQWVDLPIKFAVPGR